MYKFRIPKRKRKHTQIQKNYNIILSENIFEISF